MAAPYKPAPARWPPIALAIAGLMAVAAGAFAVASLVHFGVAITLGPLTLDDPFSGAAIPEAILALLLGIGAAMVIIRRPARWAVALATTLFALFVTIYGLSVTVSSSRTGDIVYHVSILMVLAVIVALLLLPPGRRSLSG
jgi:hypothetical protein